MIKEIAFTSYAITDVGRAREFYEGVLGLRPATEFVDGDMAFIEYELQSHTFAIGKGASYFTPGVSGGVVAFEVDDFDQMIARLEENNIPFVGEVMDYPSCRMAIVSDPEGNQIIIHQRK